MVCCDIRECITRFVNQKAKSVDLDYLDIVARPWMEVLREMIDALSYPQEFLALVTRILHNQDQSDQGWILKSLKCSVALEADHYKEHLNKAKHELRHNTTTSLKALLGKGGAGLPHDSRDTLISQLQSKLDEFSKSREQDLEIEIENSLKRDVFIEEQSQNFINFQDEVSTDKIGLHSTAVEVLDRSRTQISTFSGIP